MTKFRLGPQFWCDTPRWFGNEDAGFLHDMHKGRVLGVYMHDGYGKWDLWICLPYWRAWNVVRRQPAGFTSLAAFPYCWVWLFRAKSHAAAVSAIEALAGEPENKPDESVQGLEDGDCLTE